MNLETDVLAPAMMSLVGGAFLPPAMGVVADQFTIAAAFVAPLICFIVIGWYCLSQRSPMTVGH